MKIATNSFLGKMIQFENIKTLILQIIRLYYLLKKFISRLGPLVFHEYLLRFGKTKLILHTSKYVKQTKKVINIHFPDFLN